MPLLSPDAFYWAHPAAEDARRTLSAAEKFRGRSSSSSINGTSTSYAGISNSVQEHDTEIRKVLEQLEEEREGFCWLETAESGTSEPSKAGSNGIPVTSDTQPAHHSASQLFKLRKHSTPTPALELHCDPTQLPELPFEVVTIDALPIDANGAF